MRILSAYVAKVCCFSIIFVTATVLPTVAAAVTSTVSISPSTITWNAPTYTNPYDPADGRMAITATFKTSPNTGSGSVVIEAPASVVGARGATLPIPSIRVTCSGTNVIGQTFVANKTPLIANGSVTCVTYGAKYNHASTVIITFTIDDTVIPADTYTSGNVFSIVATAN